MTVRLIRIFACESQPVAIEGLRLALEASADLLLVGAAGPEHALPAIAASMPDVVLFGPAEETSAGFAFLERIREACPSAAIVLWIRDPEAIDPRRASELGVRAVLRRTLPAGVLLECLATVGRGGRWLESDHQPVPSAPRPCPRLTRREREIVRLLGRGLKNKEIAQTLAIAPGTVKVHLMHIFAKTGARNRYELALGARRLAGLDPAQCFQRQERSE